MSTAALAVAARRVAAASAARRMAPAAGRAFTAPQLTRAGLHTDTAARAAAGDNEPGMFERIKRMFGISKQHVAGAWPSWWSCREATLTAAAVKLKKMRGSFVESR